MKEIILQPLVDLYVLVFFFHRHIEFLFSFLAFLIIVPIYPE